MALTRSFLKGMGITDEQISAIIEAHTESTEALKAQRDSFKADAEKLAEVSKELQTLKADGSDWQARYEAEHKALEALKADASAREAKALKEARETAYTGILKELGISDKAIEGILKVTDMSTIEVVDGVVKDAEKVKATAKTEWAGFIPEEMMRGADTQTPPGGNDGSVDLGKLSMDEYIKVRNK